MTCICSSPTWTRMFYEAFERKCAILDGSGLEEEVGDDHNAELRNGSVRMGKIWTMA